MSQSHISEFYPLFNRIPKVSTATVIESSNGNGQSVDSDEDDLPLTSLLMRRAPKSRAKQKKGKKRLSPEETVNDENVENMDLRSNENKKQRQTNMVHETSTPSDNGKNSTSKSTSLTASITSKAETLMVRDAIMNKSELDISESDNAEETVDGNSGKSSENQRRANRLYSDTGMDFVAPYQAQQAATDKPYASKTRNIVHKLNNRIANGSCLLHYPYNHHRPFSNFSRFIHDKTPSISSSYMWPNKWKIPSWISLEQPSMGNSMSGGRNIEHMSWDPMGVLLAVASDRTMVIYDWDMLQAADLLGRRDRVRNCQGSKFQIPPVVKFRLPHSVGSIVWNPFEMDEIAVGFRVSGETIIYNVNRIAQWLSKNPSQNSQRLPPASAYKKIILQRVTGSVGDIIFLDMRNVLVSVGKVLYRWELSISSGMENRQQRVEQRRRSTTAGTLVWRYQLPSPVTSMTTFGSNLVVIGTNHGHMCLVDWTKRTKATLSFCHEHRPKVIKTWIPHDTLKAPNEDRSLRSQMGIMKMRVETSNQRCVVGKRHWGRCRIKWVTQSGWLLSMTLDSVRIQDDCSIHYSSPEVVYKNADGSRVNTDKKSWSLPYNAIGIDLSNQVAACFVGVPAVTKVLSHHDKFVLDSQPSTIVSHKNILVVHGIDNEIHKIPFPGIVKDLPQALAIHPSLEWIVVGERNRLHIMVNSGRVKMEG